MPAAPLVSITLGRTAVPRAHRAERWRVVAVRHADRSVTIRAGAKGSPKLIRARERAATPPRRRRATSADRERLLAAVRAARRASNDARSWAGGARADRAEAVAERAILWRIFGQRVRGHGAPTGPAQVRVHRWMRNESYRELSAVVPVHLSDTNDRATEALINLTAVPPRLLGLLRARAFQGIWLGDPPLTSIGPAQGLRGVAVGNRADLEDGTTWDQMAGLYFRQQAISVDDPATILHEVGHAIGDLLGFHQDPRLLDAHRRLYAKLDPDDAQSGPDDPVGAQELFGEGIEDVLLSPRNAAEMYDPAFVAFIQEVMRS